MKWRNLFGGTTKPTPKETEPDPKETEPDQPALSPYTSMALRARLALDLIKEFQVEADFLRKSMYKTYFPELDSGERWFELDSLQLSDDDKAEHDAEYRWHADLSGKIYWFEYFIKHHYLLLGTDKLLRDDFLKYIDKFQEDLTLHASTKEEYDLCASKTLAWMEQYLSQADDEPRIENRSAAKNFRTLQSLFEQLKTVLDLNQPLALPKYQPLDEAAEKALYWENFGLLETSKKSVAALKIVEQRANEYAELLGYKIDPSGANERNSLKNLFGDVTEYYRQKEEEKEDGNWLPKERTDHDEAVKWQNQIKCIHHAVKQWDDLVNNYENRFRPKISAKNTDVLKRKIENCRAYAESQIAAFFEVASDESRLDEPGVFETLAELKKSTRDFTESSQAKEKKEVIR